jgi:hypothetical protein
MKRIMKKIRIDEISGVALPASQHSRVAIIKSARPVDPDEEAAFDAHGSGPAHDALRDRYDDQLRSHPHRDPTENFAAAWAGMHPKARDAIRDEESGAYAARQAEEAALREAALSGRLDKRAAAILKGEIAFSTIQALAEVRRKADPKLTIEKCRAAVRATHPELARREREARMALSA